MTYVPGEDFFTAEYSGSGDVTAELQAVDLVLPPGPDASSSSSGCEAEDFADFVAGNIALVQRGTCDFSVKAHNAFEAGAVGVIIFNEGQEGRTETLSATLGDTFSDDLPVIGTSFEIGNELAALLDDGDVVIHLATDTLIELDVPTENLIAQTPTGRDDRVVMAGAHLDSVPEGPGIEDNGTGSATLLETALQLSELDIAPRNSIRFAWWGAEEAGLVGSQYYVDSLVEVRGEEHRAVPQLRHDRLAQLRALRLRRRRLGIRHQGPERQLVDRARLRGLLRFPGTGVGAHRVRRALRLRRLHHGGIPAGGLFTGAEDAKTADQVEDYGGLATFEGDPVSYDPCYHQACDSLTPIADGADADLYVALNKAYDGALEYGGTITNINTKALEEMSDAVAHSVLLYAMSTSSVNGTGKASERAAVASGERLGAHFRR